MEIYYGMPSVCRIMNNNLLPASVPISTASKIARLSFETFKARFDTSGKLSTGTMIVKGKFSSQRSVAGTFDWKVKTRKGHRTCKSKVHFTASRK